MDPNQCGPTDYTCIDTYPLGTDFRTYPLVIDIVSIYETNQYGMQFIESTKYK